MQYTKDQLAAWEKAMAMFKGDMNPTSYGTWFAPLKLHAVTQEAIVIEAENSMIVNSLRQRYYTIMSNVFGATFGRVYDIEIYTREELERQTKEISSSMLNPRYTFNNFVVGASNSFAHAAALAVAEQPSGAYNPLFIYGGVGLGKTHLMNAIGNFIQQNDPRANVLFITSETFTNELIDTIVKKKGTAELRNKMRNVDVLLVDDIQFLSKTVATQEEFFHTFNNIYEAGRQIVITSDRPPIEMSLLDDRLRTRFEGGLMADIQPPDMETRMAITRNKAAQLGLIISDEAVAYIAENITANIRQIEGVIKRLTAYREILNDTIDTESVKRAIKDVIRIGTFIPAPGYIIKATAEYYSLSEDELRGQNRSKNVAAARQISMYLIRTLTNMSLKDIGAQYEDRNHTTVLSSIRKVEALLKSDPETAAVVRDITSNINNNN